MDRRLRNRIRRHEELLTAAKKDELEKRRQQYENYRFLARLHATAVAAVVLAGEPRVDEPLVNAWTRALDHYQIDALRAYAANTDETWRIKCQIAAAQSLFAKIIGAAGETAKFTELFRTAPAWLLNFTSMWIDACFLEFDLPCECKITRVGDEQLRAWPLLPTGTMADGDPIPRGEKPMFPFPLDMNRKVAPVPGDTPDRFQKEYEFNSSPDGERMWDLGLVLDVAENPEKARELSRYQKLRLRKLCSEPELVASMTDFEVQLIVTRRALRRDGRA
jgi:hypothetical protein